MWSLTHICVCVCLCVCACARTPALCGCRIQEAGARARLVATVVVASHVNRSFVVTLFLLSLGGISRFLRGDPLDPKDLCVRMCCPCVCVGTICSLNSSFYIIYVLPIDSRPLTVGEFVMKL